MGNITNKKSNYLMVTDWFEKQSIQLSKLLRRSLLTASELKNIIKKKKLVKKVMLTAEQEKQIQDFYLRHYGKKIPDKWHRLYQSYTGKFCYDYFPEFIYMTKLEGLLNPYRESALFSDKNLLPVLFANVSDVRIPQTILSCVRGNYISGERKLLNKFDAIRVLSDAGKCVMKKSIDTSSGRDVAICCFEHGIDKNTGESAEKLVGLFGDNFIVQEYIEQHPSLANLNSSSLNTFRVMTYILKDTVYCCPAALRIGRANADRDNIHYGGITIGIDSHGLLREKAFSEYGEEYLAHPDSQVVFNRYKIEGFHKLLEVAKELHTCMPYLGILSWDLSLDKENKPVLIEINTERQSVWFPQMANGESLFGCNTADILEMIR